MPYFNREVRVVFEGIDIDPITKLRVQFDADKSDGEAINRCTIHIFNMRPSSRAALSAARPANTILIEPFIKVSLFAGYDGDTRELMSGNIHNAFSVRNGSDWITTIVLHSGLSNAINANVNLSFDGKTDAEQIANALVEPLGVSLDYTEEAFDILVNKTYTDFSESGMSLRSITTFLNALDLAFTIEENDVGLIYKLNSPRDGVQPRTPENSFNKNNGLVGAPIISRTGASFTALLRPEIKIFQTIYIESQTIMETLQGNEELTNKYFVKSIRHFGDTHDDSWFTEIDARYADINDGFYDA